jgi:UDPglucose 6-dehydrogenase
MGLDRRIGQSFLQPGPGWGGSCLPKDTQAFLQVAAAVEFDFALLRATVDTNIRQRELMVDKVRDAVGGSLAGTRIGLLGLAFKAGTDDLRDSPALAVAKLLADEGAELTAYDPGVVRPVPSMTDMVRLADNACQAVKGAAAAVVLTEWPEFRMLDWARLATAMEGTIVVDTRNHLDPEMLYRAGLSWRGVGDGLAAVSSAVRQHRPDQSQTPGDPLRRKNGSME